MLDQNDICHEHTTEVLNRNVLPVCTADRSWFVFVCMFILVEYAICIIVIVIVIIIIIILQLDIGVWHRNDCLCIVFMCDSMAFIDGGGNIDTKTKK